MRIEWDPSAGIVKSWGMQELEYQLMKGNSMSQENSKSLHKVYATNGTDVKELTMIAKDRTNAIIKFAIELGINPDEWDIFAEHIGTLKE